MATIQVVEHSLRDQTLAHSLDVVVPTGARPQPAGELLQHPGVVHGLADELPGESLLRVVEDDAANFPEPVNVLAPGTLLPP